MENLVYSIGAAVIGLGLLIVFHEFGHFLLAKLSGVGVLTFSVGFGPKLWVRKKGETEYALSAFPLGGYVKMVGEDPDEEVRQEDVEKSFAHKSLLTRIAIVVAGPGFNLLLALVLLIGVFTFYGVPVMSTQVSGVEAGSPAQRAGILKGDRIVAIDGKPVKEWEALSRAIKSSGGKALTLEIRRGTETVNVNVQPMKKESRNLFGERKDDWIIGIGSQVSIEKGNPGLAVVRAVYQTYDYAQLTRRIAAQYWRSDFDCANGRAASAGGARQFSCLPCRAQHQSGRPEFVAGARPRRRTPVVLSRGGSDAEASCTQVSGNGSTGGHLSPWVTHDLCVLQRHREIF